jgi:SHS2 domain-containing protein
MLSGNNIKTRRPSKKFNVKMHGPFKVIKAVSPAAYRLKLPKNWSIHPMFYILLLEPYRKSIDPERPPPDLD